MKPVAMEYSPYNKVSESDDINISDALKMKRKACSGPYERPCTHHFLEKAKSDITGLGNSLLKWGLGPRSRLIQFKWHVATSLKWDISRHPKC